MRSVLAAAILAVTPLAANAQAMHTGVSHLVASMDAPAFAFQASAIKAGPRVFTGLVAPIRMTQLKLAGDLHAVHSEEVTMQYTVNPEGVPQNVKVVSAADALTAARVEKAVSELRYKAGTLNGQPVDVPVTLHVALR